MLAAGASRQTVRLAGIEARDERERRELLAAEVRLLAGESVRLESVAAQGADKDEPRSALLYRLPDGLCVNFEIVRQGSSRAAPLPQRDTDRALRYYENVAKGARKGIWNVEHEAPTPAAAPASAKQTTTKTPPPRASQSASNAPDDSLVYVTKSGRKYHRQECRHARGDAKAITLREAREKYTPCSQCHPPE